MSKSCASTRLIAPASWFLLATGPCLCGVAAAEGETVEQVTVTGHLEEDLPVEIAKYGTRVDTVTAETIRNNVYLDVAQTLQAQIPGLYVSPKNGPFDYADVSLLGSRSQDILWLVDGVRINNRLYGSTLPLDTLPASMVDRIEVLEGPQALFYGTQSTAGAVNVVTKGFSATPDGALALGGDTQHGRHVDGYFRDTLAGQQFVLFASDDQAAGFRPFRDQDYQPSSTDRDRSYNIRTFGAKYALSPMDSLRLSATAQHTEGKVDDAYPAYIATAFNERDEDVFTAKLDYTPSDVAQLFVKGYFHNWRSHYTEFDNDPDAPNGLDTVDDHDFWGFKDYGGSAMAKFAPTKGLEYYVGADYQSYSGNDAVLVITQKSEHVHAFFGEVATTPDLVKDLRLAAGLRYNDPSTGDSATVWDVSGHYQLPGDLFIQALVGTAFRLPTAEELFANDPEDERGNPNLRPERSRNVNVSFGGYFDDHRSKWEIVGFYRKIQDLITSDGFDEATDQSLFINVTGSVQVRGAQFVLTSDFMEQASATFSYTYNHARQAGDLQITKVPEQLGKVAFDYHPAGTPFGASASVNYVGHIFQSVWDGREDYGNYATVDLAGRFYLDPQRHQTITARVQNLFDKQYAASIGTSQRDSDGSDYTYWNRGMPRTLQLRYTYSF